MDIDEKVGFYISEDGSSVNSLLRKLDRSIAEIPIYANRRFVSGINVGFCSDERMFGKVFMIDCVAENGNVPLGPYVVKNPLSMLEVFNSKSYNSELVYALRQESDRIDPRLFMIPSEIIITSNSDNFSEKFTIMAKENPTMRLSKGMQV